jgi:hypothetical protein
VYAPRETVKPHILGILFALALGWMNPCQAMNCREALALVEHHLGLQPDFSDEYRHYRRTIRSFPELKQEGLHGGYRIPIMRIGEVWPSDYHEGPNAPQGDPRNFITAFGIDTALFFGFSLLSPRDAEIPDFTEFNGAIRKVNAELLRVGAEPIGMRYYPSLGEVGPSRYIFEFVENSAIPLAQREAAQLHDLSFHSVSIILPNDLIDHARLQTRVVEEFGAYLKKIANGEIANPTKLSRDEVAQAIRVVQMQRLYELDSLTANFAVAAYSLGLRSLDASHEIINQSLHYHMRNGAAGVPFLRGFLEDAVDKVDPSFFSSWKRERSLWFLHWRSRVKKSELQHLLKGVLPAFEPFIQQRLAKGDDALTYGSTADDICQQMQTKRANIATAVKRLLYP